MKIEGSPKEIADLLQRLQDQQFKNGVYSLGDTTVTSPTCMARELLKQTDSQDKYSESL